MLAGTGCGDYVYGTGGNNTNTIPMPHRRHHFLLLILLGWCLLATGQDAGVEEEEELLSLFAEEE